MDDLRNKKVLLVTTDGRVVVGILKGFDAQTNLILSKASERAFSTDSFREIPQGLHVVRGDTIAIIGEIDEEKDDAIDWQAVRADPITSIRI
ncbi:hypothetical protein BJ742DRAFT_832767 [Cladochytrium replicatum]|nr:hypothetical protein BJ742DRAFT_832767 [Cladochytrium replicatum]